MSEWISVKKPAKRYTIRKLPHFEILGVASCTRNTAQIAMRPIRAAVDGEVPEGCFVSLGNQILLPKRKRGERFVVNYTVVHRTVL